MIHAESRVHLVRGSGGVAHWAFDRYVHMENNISTRNNISNLRRIPAETFSVAGGAPPSG